MRAAVVLCVAASVAAGCSASSSTAPQLTDTSASPAPDVPSSTTPPPTSPTSPTSTTGGLPSLRPATTVTLPPRPRSFDLATVDPCVLMPPERRAEFGLDQPPFGPTREGDVIDCSISSTDTAAMGIFVDLAEGAATKLTNSSVYGEPFEQVAVNGFTVTVIASPDPVACFAVVDTGETENLTIEAYSMRGVPIEETCRIVEQWTPVVMDTLARIQP